MSVRGGGRLSRRWARAASFAACLVLGACGASEAVKVAPPKAPEPKPPVVVDVDTPLGLPEDTILIGRWRSPAELLEKLALPGARAGSLELALRARIGEPQHAVDLQKPIEFVAVLDRSRTPPQVAWAVSLGLSGDAPSPSAHGPIDVASPIGLRCAEASALGSAQRRMVCAAADEHLAQLLGAATRAVPLSALGDADVAFSLRTQPLRGIEDRALDSIVSGWLSEALGVPSMNERFDEQFAVVASALARELRDIAEDLDAAAVELSLAPHAEGLELSIEAPAAPHRSTLAALVLGTRASALAPADFWYAHATSAEAGYLWSFDAAKVERWRAAFGELLDTALSFRGVPARLGGQASYLLESFPVPRGPIVHASGVLPAPIDARSLRGAAPDRRGWHMLVLRGSFAEYQYYVSELVKAWSDPILSSQFSRLLRAAFGPDAAPSRLKQRRPNVTGRLPKHSFTLEITWTNALAGAASDEREGDARNSDESTLFVLMAPDEDDGVKIAWGADEKFLASLLTEPAKLKATATLASRPGLALLNERRMLAGGFYSLSALGAPGSRIAASLGVEQGAAAEIGNAPHGGQSPIVYSLDQATEAEPLSFTAKVGRETIEDLLFLISAASRPE